MEQAFRQLRVQVFAHLLAVQIELHPRQSLQRAQESADELMKSLSADDVIAIVRPN